jgi:hypothetical protein
MLAMVYVCSTKEYGYSCNSVEYRPFSDNWVRMGDSIKT